MSNSRVRVLLFEDDFGSMNPLREFLQEELQWSVELTAEKGILERLETERFDLVVVDVMIYRQSPYDQRDLDDNVHFAEINWEETGLEFLRRLRRGDFSTAEGRGTPPDVPVIILTALPREMLEVGLEGLAPAPVYWAKPFRLDDLVGDMIRLVSGEGDGH